MKFEIYNGELVGTAEWRGPGDVALDVADAAERAWFERYFSAEDSFLRGPVEASEMSPAQRRDSSAEAFAHAAYWLAAYHYEIRDDNPMPAYHGGRSTA